MEAPWKTPSPSNGPISTPKQAHSIHLILDFDGTVTHEDTTKVLAEIARDRLTRSPEESVEHSRRWESCCQKYYSEIVNHTNFKALKGTRMTINNEIDFQRNMRVVEEASVKRVGRSGVFKGVTAWAWRESGWQMCQSKRVNITKGFQALIETVQNRGRWGVVSANWSQDFVKGVLGFALGDDMNTACAPVLSNRVVGDTGFIGGPNYGLVPDSGPAMDSQLSLNEGKLILTCDDKLEAMKSMRNSFGGSTDDQTRLFQSNTGNHLEKASEETPLIPLVLYVGDSMTDIECLLEADVGIVMNCKGNGDLMEFLERYGINTSNISFWEPQQGKSIWFARDFQDILNCELFAETTTESSKLQPESCLER